MKVVVPKATPPPTPQVDTKAIESGASDLVADARTKLAQVKELISEKNFNQAETVLAQVEAMKDKLPADVQTIVTQTRAALDTAKKANISMPEMPAMPKMPE